MSDPAKPGAGLTKQDYEQQSRDLRVVMLRAQQRLAASDFAMLITLVGNDRPGVNQVANLLHEWFDPRGIETHAPGPPSDEDRQCPPLWRDWLALPATGRIGLFLRPNLMLLIADHAAGRLGRKAFDRALQRCAAFERTLIDGGTLLVKIWLHLPHAEFKKRLRHARDSRRGAPLDKEDVRAYRRAAKAMPSIEHALRKTGTGPAPWHTVESTDPHHRNVSVARTILESVAARFDAPPPPPLEVEAEAHATAAGRVGRAHQAPVAAAPLDAVDLSKTIDKDDYDRKLARLQAEVHRLTTRSRVAGVAAVLVFEGWDAAGKGGCIRRLTAAIDAENYRVVPVAAPNDEEKAHHYLWRFWRRLPPAGCTTVFDRSWYGRVLVERFEGFAAEHEWRRAYQEINEFEEQLADHGLVLCKFWLHMDKDEQFRRFEEREQSEFKRHKMTPDDWRNRGKWDEYEAAVNEMIQRTSPRAAPWTLVSANDQHWARLEVLHTFRKRLSRAL